MIEAKQAESARDAIPDAQLDGVILGAFPRTVTFRDGDQQLRVVMDVRVDAGELGVRVLPFWMSPVLIGPTERRPGTRLYQVLAALGLLERVQDRFPDTYEWVEPDAHRALAEWLHLELPGRVVRVRTRATRRSGTGERYSLIESISEQPASAPERPM